MKNDTFISLKINGFCVNTFPLVKKMRNALYITLLLLAGMLVQAGNSGAQDTNSGEPIHIEADRMVSKQQQNAVIFTGNVAASQGDLTIHSDEMTVFHDKSQAAPGAPEQKGGSQKIKKLHAVGNVEIIQEGLVATGNEMEFFSDKRKVIIIGNTKVWQNNNLVTGERIELDLNTDTTIIEPSKKDGGRVKAFFYPGEDKKTK